MVIHEAFFNIDTFSVGPLKEQSILITSALCEYHLLIGCGAFWFVYYAYVYIYIVT